MELSTGNTEVELSGFPDDWEQADLCQIVQIIDGDRGTNYPGPGELSRSGYCLFLNAGNVTQDGFRFSESTFITKDKDRLLRNGKLRRTDIVLTTRGTVGNLAYFDESIAIEHMRINSGMVILRNYSPSLDTSFLYAFLRSQTVEAQIERLSFGSAQPQLTVGGIGTLRIVIPPLIEQHAIAAALSDTDDLIASLERLIAKKRAVKQAAMQQLLTGKTRLPGFEGEWEVKPIGDIFSVTAGGDFEPGYSSPIHDELHPYPIFSNAVSDQGLYGYCSYHAHLANSITVTARGTLGVAVYRDHHFTAIGRVLVLQPRSIIDGRFFAEAINHTVAFVVESTGVPQLTAPQISKYTLSVPLFDEQTAIATVLTDMDAEITALEQKRDKTCALKQGMMQELLTGRIRLV